MSECRIAVIQTPIEAPISVSLDESYPAIGINDSISPIRIEHVEAPRLSILTENQIEEVNLDVKTESLALFVEEEALNFQLIVDRERGATGAQGPVGPQGQPGPQGPQGNPANMFAEVVEITAQQILSASITLQYLPGNSLGVLVDVVGGTSQRQFFDYIVSGQVLSWNNLGLQTVIQVGDVIRVSYTI